MGKIISGEKQTNFQADLFDFTQLITDLASPFRRKNPISIYLLI